MAITIGTQLGSHEITALLGKGGMGEVYRARDTKLKREVAIKILPEEFARDSDRVSRFQREAEVLASLNHPNIAAIYDLQESAGSRYLVLELVEGETLAERLARGSIPVEEALGIAKSICEALEGAHDKGIIHRDLKPANVKLTPDGKVKVLDFGLAKAINSTPAPSALSNSPTMISGTMGGVILGTAAYMSPEQAKGMSADARSDLFSFGTVLYEMLTGRQAFQGETGSEILASVLIRDPDFTVLPAGLNSRLYDLLKRCLEKNSKRRWHCAGDLRTELEAVASDLRPKAEPAAASIGRSTMLWKIASLLLVVAAVLGFGLGYIYRVPAAATQARFFVVAPEKTSFVTGGRPGTSAVISPDGRKLAFTAADANGKIQIWVRGIDSLAAQPLAGTDGANFPFWSPDSRFIAYFAQDKLMKVDTTGGPPQTLANAPNQRGGTWSREGVIVFGSGGTGGNLVLYRVSSGGGQPVAFTKSLPSGDGGHRFPSFLPDQHHVLFHLQGSEPAGIYVASIDSGEMKRIVGTTGRDVSSAVYIAPGYLLFAREGTLLAQAFNPKTLQLSEEPFPIAEGVLTGVFNGVAAFSVSDKGVLAYGTGAVSGSDEQLVWTDRTGKQIEAVAQRGNYMGLDLSPDGKTIAAHRHDTSDGGDIWLLDASRGTNLRFTFDATRDNVSPVWSPDGSQIFYAVVQSGKWKILQKASTGAATEELLLQSDSPVLPQSVSPDGKSLVYLVSNAKTRNDLWLLPLSGDRKPAPLVVGVGDQQRAQISPDGKWLAYQSNETGNIEIYIVPFPSGAGKWQISNSTGFAPRWRHDGRELFYISATDERRKFMAIEIDARGPKLEPGVPRELFTTIVANPPHSGGPSSVYAVSGDGQRFLIQTLVSRFQQTEGSGGAPIVIVLNLLEDLKQRAPVR
jgi:Tol biopolymer transport system component